MACAQFNKGECTFLEEPVKRSNRRSSTGKVSTKQDGLLLYPQKQEGYTASAEYPLLLSDGTVTNGSYHAHGELRRVDTSMSLPLNLHSLLLQDEYRQYSLQQLQQHPPYVAHRLLDASYFDTEQLSYAHYNNLTAARPGTGEYASLLLTASSNPQTSHWLPHTYEHNGDQDEGNSNGTNTGAGIGRTNAGPDAVYAHKLEYPVLNRGYALLASQTPITLQQVPQQYSPLGYQESYSYGDHGEYFGTSFAPEPAAMQGAAFHYTEMK